MVQQLVRIEPTVVSYTAPDGSSGWRTVIPNINKYSLIKTFQFGDDSYTTPLSGHNTQVWLIEGSQSNIDNFVATYPTIITTLTPTDAETLANTIRPARTTTCDHCGGTGVMVRPAWTSPI